MAGIGLNPSGCCCGGCTFVGCAIAPLGKTLYYHSWDDPPGPPFTVHPEVACNWTGLNSNGYPSWLTPGTGYGISIYWKNVGTEPYACGLFAGVPAGQPDIFLPDRTVVSGSGVAHVGPDSLTVSCNPFSLTYVYHWNNAGTLETTTTTIHE